MWVATQKLPRSPGHPFYERLNQVLEKAGFRRLRGGLCARFYARRDRAAESAAGRYFRMLLVGYFEGLNSERAIAWRVADSMSLRAFLDLDPEETPPNHSTLSRTRRRIDVETHREVFTWVLARLAEAGLVRGKTIGIDATTLEATRLCAAGAPGHGEDYETFVKGLANSSGVPTPTRKELVRFDPQAQEEDEQPGVGESTRPGGEITKLKDGRTRLGHKVEEAVDLETGAVVAVTAPEELGDAQTMGTPSGVAREEVKAVGSGAQVREVVTDQGYHSNETILELKELGLRGYLSEPDRGRRNWKGKNRNTRRQSTPIGDGSGAGGDDGCSGSGARWWSGRSRTSSPREGLRRIFVRGHANVRKRLLIHVCGFNLGLLMRHLDRVRDAPESAGPSPGASFCAFWGEKGPFDRLESALEALLGVDPARFEVLGFPDESINHFHVRLRKER